jgi:hypothetical protein
MSFQLQHCDAPTIARLEIIAEELASYGLGIAAPHMHNDSGDRIALPASMCVLEQSGMVSFLKAEELPPGANPVGWRWSEGELAAFAHCCGHTDPPSQFPGTIA